MSWTQKASKGGDGNFERAPAGNHPAVLIGLIDMGTQENNYQGNVTWQHRAYFVYELVMEKMTTFPGKNHILAIDLTVSMNEKAKLRKWVEARTGKQIPDGVEYDISQELGQPVLLNVVLNKDGYPKIESVGSVPKGMTVPAPQNKPVIMSLEDFKGTGRVPEFCPWLYGEKLEDHIKRAQEITGKGTNQPAPATAPPSVVPVPPSGAPKPPSANGAPAPPAANGATDRKFWLDVGGGKVKEFKESESLDVLTMHGVAPEFAMVLLEGTNEWKPAASFGMKTAF
jgi:hypothetical protein